MAPRGPSTANPGPQHETLKERCLEIRVFPQCLWPPVLLFALRRPGGTPLGGRPERATPPPPPSLTVAFLQPLANCLWIPGWTLLASAGGGMLSPPSFLLGKGSCERGEWRGRGSCGIELAASWPVFRVAKVLQCPSVRESQPRPAACGLQTPPISTSPGHCLVWTRPGPQPLAASSTFCSCPHVATNTVSRHGHGSCCGPPCPDTACC